MLRVYRSTVMRFVLNTRSDTAGAAASIFALAHRLRGAGFDATVGDWSGYAGYDVAIFMGYDHELERARAENPEIRVGLADPKQSRQEWIDAARAADFLLVSSVEQRDAFLRLNRNTFVLLMFPLVPAATRVHAESETLTLGYHGNRVHLEAMRDSVTPAIEQLARARPVELVVVTNVDRHGAPATGLPTGEGVSVRLVQFEAGSNGELAASVVEALGTVDVGLVPNLLPVARREDALRLTATKEPWLAYEPFDYLLRFKASSNPGRLYPFARLGVPVVADFTPSLAQFVEDGVSGFLAGSAEGWVDALARLAGSAELRERMATGLRERLDHAVARQPVELVEFVRGVRPGAATAIAVDGGRSAEDDLADLAGYASTARPTFGKRAAASLARRLGR